MDPTDSSQHSSQRSGRGSPAGSELVPIFIKLPPEHIVSLKFVIESYEGIGIVRTLDQHTGEVVVLALQDTAGTVRAVLHDIGQNLDLKVVPPPPSIEGDWLLAEEYGS